MADGGHVPVLMEKVLEALAPVDGGVYVDGTYGGGGYTRALLAIADAKVLAVDRDPDAMERAWAHAGKDDRVRPAPGCFGELDLATRAAGHEYVDGVMLDLGVSSYQLDQAPRGFSFMRDGPLDMRMAQRGVTAADAVNLLGERDLTAIFHYYGEEPGARRMAKAIINRRAAEPFVRTLDLAELAERVLGSKRGKRAHHPATRIFQALRLYVNDELGELVRALSAAESVLSPHGRLVVVTFHSLEDRIVKSFLRARSGHAPGGSRHAPETPKGAPASFELLARKALEPSDAEVSANPRARSARLRWALRTEAPGWGEAAEDGFGAPDLKTLERLKA
ncbi:MAG: 16S rRNA (cytosine(1402)-N(4))-methyltransferase RsmH [Pseudomonadota bacterium]